MKKLTLILSLCAFSLISFAQAAFTEQTLQGIRQSMIADFSKFVKEETTPNFLFANAEGRTMTGEQMKAAAANLQMKELEFGKDVKIQQSSKIAIVTGSNKHTMLATDGKSFIYHVRFTYIYENMGGKWKWANAQHTYIIDQDDPIEVYKQWAEEYNKDTKAFLLDKCPDDLIGTNNGGAFYNNSGFKDMKEGQTANLQPYDMKSFRSGNLAVIMGKFKNTVKQADGTEKPVNEMFTAVLQKRNGKWLYVGHHATLAKE